ncbi:phosphatidylinositol phosphatase PTPRQ-like isoform X1 [Schistocerca nitens]|uniref:phosphatidylinositol phosphatase PTPRQ-like isoform X1 n=1 Tax=Schistocerca nitens TaxID=7011 RepID=UPI0021196381|nr:phosphatidylinositol phosphatase PTPRQ-like isoform X1 [Schistocerca nitens]
MDTSLLLMLILLIVNCVCCVKVTPSGKSSSITTKGYPTTESVSTEPATTAVFADSVQNLTVSDVTSSSFIVSWEPPVYGTESFIERYVVYINCSNETSEDSCEMDCSLIIDSVDADQTVYIFQNATPFTTYEVTVQPESNLGSWLPATTRLRTDEDLPDEPENLSVEENNGVVIVSWDPPKCKRGLLIFYNIHVSCIKSKDGPSCPCQDNSSMNSTISASLSNGTFYGIKAFSIYRVSVSAETKKGAGDSAEKIFSTTEGVPEKPKSLFVSESNGTLSLQWEPPTCIQGVLLYYHVIITCKVSRNGPDCPCPQNSSISIKEPPSETQTTFVGLHPYSEYSVAVAAVTKIGVGNSKEASFNTTEDVPDEPKSLSVSESNGTLSLQWEPPTCSRGILLYYHVTITCKGPRNGPDCPCPQNSSASIKEPQSVTQTKFVGVHPYSEYNVAVAAETKIGVGNSKEVPFNTAEDVPDSPVNVSIRNILPREFTVVWYPPTCVNGELWNYVVTVEYISEEEINCQPPSHHYWSSVFDENVTEYTFPYGWPFSKYNVSVISVASGGNSSSYPQEAKTLEDIPGIPEDLTVSPDFNITWKQPLCTNGILQVYYVIITFWRPVEISDDCPKEESKIYSFSISPNTVDYHFTEEKPYSVYSVCVLAATNAGNGSDICTNFRSKAVVLDGPRVLEVESLNPRAANITWKNPCPITDEIVKFSGHFSGYRPGFEYHATWFEQEGQLLYYTIEDLKPEYRYSLVMHAYGKMLGKGNKTITYFQQPAGIPGVLQNVSNELRSSPLDTHDPTRQALISVPTHIFDSANGNIVYFAIFVALYSSDQNSTSGYLETPIQLSNCNITWPDNSYWGDVTVNGIPSSEYQATPDCWYPPTAGGVFTFVLGTDESCSTHQYCNGPLHPRTEYTFKVRAYTSHGYQDSYVVPFHTDSEVAVGLTLGLVFGFLMAGTVLFGFVMYRNGQISCSLATILNNNDTRDVCPRPIPLKNFPKHCELLLDIPGRLSSEFQLLSTLCVDINDTNTFSVGRLPDNKRKNRYINILPFDANRVKLDIVDGDPSSDYINASFIQGYSKNIEYIATQGPKEETVKDFWLMVYQYDVTIIVMVTQLEEQGKVKCHQYYPNLRETAKYGEISVKCSIELQFSIYTSRTIMLEKGQERKKIVHLHFREWPDFGCPTTTDVMLQFCQIVRHQILLSSAGLTVVHCSAGVGRTGTLIALDILLQHIRENKTIDIFGVVYNLRKQRTNMVQSEAQYAYIYKCMRDALANTAYPKHDKTSTSSLEPIYESAGPALNATVHDSSRMLNAKSNITENEYEL